MGLLIMVGTHAAKEGEIFKISMYSYAGMALPGLSPCLADATLREANMRLSKANLN
jgi:hypothetical protein